MKSDNTTARAEYNAIQSWIDNVGYSHSNSQATADNYKTSFSRFLLFIDKTVEDIIREYEQTTDREFKRRYAQYLRAWISRLNNKGYSTNTIACLVAAIKSFFKYNDLPLEYVPIAQNSVQYANRDIAKEELVHILSVSKPRDRAFFVFMAQSGLRPYTITKLRMKHLEPDWSNGKIPCNVQVPKEIAKGKFQGHFSFLGAEAVKYLKDYLKTRSKLTRKSLIFTSHGTEKPLNRVSISHRFRDAVRKLKRKELIDFEVRENGKPSELRLYTLRKFFRKYGGQAGADYTNFWMGHRANYKASHIPASDEHYFSKEDVEFHRKLYAEKAMPHLRLETPTPSEMEKATNGLRAQLEERNGEIGDLRGVIWDLQGAIASLEKRVEATEEKWEPTAEQLEFIESTQEQWREEQAKKKKKKPLS